jgi:thymidylate kinase
MIGGKESNGRPPGILIAVEGIDGAGKTTQVERLCNALGAADEIVTRSKEPKNFRMGEGFASRRRMVD